MQPWKLGLRDRRWFGQHLILFCIKVKSKLIPSLEHSLFTKPSNLLRFNLLLLHTYCLFIWTIPDQLFPGFEETSPPTHSWTPLLPPLSDFVSPITLFLLAHSLHGKNMVKCVTYWWGDSPNSASLQLPFSKPSYLQKEYKKSTLPLLTHCSPISTLTTSIMF